MSTQRFRAKLFFAVYGALLIYGLVWSRFPYVRAHLGENLHLYYFLVGSGLAYVALRSYAVLSSMLRSPMWEYGFLLADLLLITGTVALTGGIRSEAAIVYVLPILTQAVQRAPRRALMVGVFSALLYIVAVKPLDLTTGESAFLVTRLLIMMFISLIAASYALTEIQSVRELTKLHEELAILDYRSRLSQEMHDGIQHYLAAMAARLSLAQGLMERDPAQAARMAVGQLSVVQQAADELRYLIRRLRSPRLERRGFVQAVREHVAMFRERVDFDISISVRGEPVELPPYAEQAAFRIVQEALTNTQKHAGATQATVELDFGEDTFQCSVTDDGKGFEADPSSTPPADGTTLGLVGMRDRADAVGGSLTVQSGPGHGTTINFALPREEENGE